MCAVRNSACRLNILPDFASWLRDFDRVNAVYIYNHILYFFQLVAACIATGLVLNVQKKLSLKCSFLTISSNILNFLLVLLEDLMFSLYIPLTGFRLNVLMKLDAIIETQKEHSALIQTILLGGENTNQFPELEDLLPSKLRTIDDMDALGDKVKNDKEYKKKLVRRQHIDFIDPL